MLAREIEQQPDDLVFQPAQPLGAAASVAVVEQELFGFGAAVGERRFQPLRDCRASLAVAAAARSRELVEPGRDCANVDQFVARAGMGGMLDGYIHGSGI